VSIGDDDGPFEYSRTGRGGLSAQQGNCCAPQFWSFLRDLLRFDRNSLKEARARIGRHEPG